MSKGYLMLAIDPEYITQACLCAMSIKLSQNINNVSIMTNEPVPDKYKDLFDEIIMPTESNGRKDFYRTSQRWKAFHITPYDETVVLDTDMLFLTDISHWWDFLYKFDLLFTTTVKTYRGEIITNDYYRKIFTENKLPNLYCAFHYFKKKDIPLEFYKTLAYISRYDRAIYNTAFERYRPDRPSMDVNCALAARMLGLEEEIICPQSLDPHFVHMKSKIQNWNDTTESWRQKINSHVTDRCDVIIGNYKQQGILHYTDNTFVNENLLSLYERNLQL